MSRAALPWVSARSAATETQCKIAAPFTVAAVGDVISPQPLKRSDPRFTALIDRIRAADLGFANMESSLIPAGFPHAIAGTAAPLAMGEALRDMGLTVMSRANNHTFDCGVLGMIETDRALDALGITHAGTGMNLQEARGARYRETPKGRVGMVSFYSVSDTGNFGPTYARTLATRRDGDIGGAPGVNPLRLTQFNVVSPEQLQTLRDVAAATYGDRPGAWRPGDAETPPRLRFYDQWYEAGEDPGALHYDMHEGDRKGILSAITNGKIYADFLIATIHSHQAGHFDAEGGFDGHQGLKEPIEHHAPDFLRRIAREAIDAGADMFISHGVHALAGVEIYRGRPIFYGLSNFVFQCGLQYGATHDVLANWSGKAELEHPGCHVAVLTESVFEGGRLAEVRLHPVDLGGARRPLSQMGIPMLPDPALAGQILGDLQEYSRPYGTDISIEGGIGVIRT